MHSKIRMVTIAAAAIIALLGGTASHAQTADPGDCNAAKPPVEGSDKHAGKAQNDAAPHDSLSDQLATCGSVLNPPAVGDGDVVQPAPAIDDPLAIHPQDPQLKKK
jgi:hypothetical protein